MKSLEPCVHVGANQVELADDVVESVVHGVIVVVNQDGVFLGECEIAGVMGRSVTQTVLWVSSTHKPKVFLARPAVDTE